MRRWGPLLGLGVLVVTAAWLRFHDLSATMWWGTDQAQHGIAERAIFFHHNLWFMALGQASTIPNYRPGAAFFWLQAPFYLALNFSPFADAAAEAFYGTVAVVVTWWLARSIFGQGAAIVAAALAAIATPLVDAGREGWAPNLFTLIVPLSMALVLASTRCRWWVAFLAGVSLAVGMQMDEAGIVVPVGVAVWLAWERPTGWQRSALAGAAGGLAAWTPWLVWNAKHGWQMFPVIAHLVVTRQVPGMGRFGEPLQEAAPRVAGMVLGLPAPIAIVVVVAGVAAAAWLAFTATGQTRSGARLILCLHLGAFAIYLSLRSSFQVYYLNPWEAMLPVTVAALVGAAARLPRLGSMRVAVLAALGVALAAASLPVAAAAPARRGACGYANLERATLAIAGHAPGPYRLEWWDPYPWDADRVNGAQAPQYILWLRGRMAPNPTAPDGYAIAMTGWDQSDPRPEIEQVRRSRPGLEVVQIDGCFAVLHLGQIAP